MKSQLFFVPLALLLSAAIAHGTDSDNSKGDKSQIVKTTYSVTGLHCPPCTKTVESSLSKVKGIHSINVDWKSKNAQIEFDESVLPAQKVARLIADTPHMMGGNMHYDGLLVIKVSSIKDDATAKPVIEALSKVEGIQHVVGYPSQHSVGVQFSPKGSLTSEQLLDALKKAGFEATI